MRAWEVNLDGLVGPTHHYGGLAYGNIASQNNSSQISHPREAAKQGLQKMKFLADLGIKQMVLPPHERPDINTLKKLGFIGKEENILKRAQQKSPSLFYACCSSSGMWTANAATVSPSADTQDNKVHFTPANLISHFHRSIESGFTGKVLKKVFSSQEHFVHHEPLPPQSVFSDEGAANHIRFCSNHEQPGVEFFVFGKYGLQGGQTNSQKFPARQSFEASETIARMHKLNLQKVFFVQQNPTIIDQGGFHNDVISTGNENVFLYHSLSFVDVKQVIEGIKEYWGENDFFCLEVPDKRISVIDSVHSYLFNSQLVSLSSGGMALIAPTECENNEKIRDYLLELQEGKNPIQEVHYLDLRQSMKNGGGPACLRLRVILNEKEIKKINPHHFLDENLFLRLNQWVDAHYREELSLEDLIDPSLLEETRTALDELCQILELGEIYDFQK